MTLRAAIDAKRKDCTCDPATVTQEWRRRPLGLACSGHRTGGHGA